MSKKSQSSPPPLHALKFNLFKREKIFAYGIVTLNGNMNINKLTLDIQYPYHQLVHYLVEPIFKLWIYNIHIISQFTTWFSQYPNSGYTISISLVSSLPGSANIQTLDIQHPYHQLVHYLVQPISKLWIYSIHIISQFTTWFSQYPNSGYTASILLVSSLPGSANIETLDIQYPYHQLFYYLVQPIFKLWINSIHINSQFTTCFSQYPNSGYPTSMIIVISLPGLANIQTLDIQHPYHQDGCSIHPA